MIEHNVRITWTTAVCGLYTNHPMHNTLMEPRNKFMFFHTEAKVSKKAAETLQSNIKIMYSKDKTSPLLIPTSLPQKLVRETALPALAPRSANVSLMASWLTILHLKQPLCNSAWSACVASKHRQPRWMQHAKWFSQLRALIWLANILHEAKRTPAK